MPEIRVDWEWESISPLHVGSGLSRPGVADNLVQRDPDGCAVIYGEAVKGALRMGAEHVVAWLGKPQETLYDSQGTAEPKAWPLARLFGGGAVARCTPATAIDENDSENRGPAARSHVVASTAIDRATGTARDQTLRKTEIVPEGLRFRAGYSACVAKDDVEAIETLLLAALASVDSVGGRAGIGWGRMGLRCIRVTVDGEKHDPACVLSADRLKELREALEVVEDESRGNERTERECVTGVHSSAARVSDSPSSSFQWFRLAITLKEPTCLPGPPEISNKVTTYDWIAATTLRGALAGYWRRSGRTGADVVSWLSESTCWTPGFRVIDDALALPAPRSYVTTKRPVGAARPLHDTFCGAPAGTHDGKDLQWRPAGSRSIRWSGEQAEVAGDGGLRETRMHVARNYRTGSKRAGALYARESLVPGTVFVSWARVPASAFESESKSGRELELLLGKRVSTGNGRAAVRVEKVDGPAFLAFPENGADSEAGPPAAADAGQAQAHRPQDQAVGTGGTGEDRPPHTASGTMQEHPVFVHQLSPAVVRDSEGYPHRTLDCDWWNQWCKDEFDIELPEPGDGEDAGGRTAPGRRGGWMASWGHARAAVTTIEAGSVWRLRCASPGDAEALRSKLRERPWIGERVHEGFGWVAVDPPWLGRRSKQSLPEATTPAPKAGGEPSPWPGIVGTDACTLAHIARWLAKQEVGEEDAAAFREFAARVRVAPGQSSGDSAAHLDALKKFCESRATKNRSRWKRVKAVVIDSSESRDFKLWAEPQRLLFALDVLATRGATRQHN